MLQTSRICSWFLYYSTEWQASTHQYPLLEKNLCMPKGHALHKATLYLRRWDQWRTSASLHRSKNIVLLSLVPQTWAVCPLQRFTVTWLVLTVLLPDKSLRNQPLIFLDSTMSHYWVASYWLYFKKTNVYMCGSSGVCPWQAGFVLLSKGKESKRHHPSVHRQNLMLCGHDDSFCI